MVVCGISGRRRGAAAALAVDGRIVAAVEQARVTRAAHAGYDGASAPWAAVEACASVAGIALADVTCIVRASSEPGGGTSLRVGRDGDLGARDIEARVVSRVDAYAALAHAYGADVALVGDGAVVAAVATHGVRHSLSGSAFATLTPRVTRALGLHAADVAGAITALELLAASEPQARERWLAEVDALPEDGVTAERLEAAVATDLSAAERALGVSLAETSSPLVRAERARVSIADAWLTSVAQRIAAAADDAGPHVVLAGSLFASPDFVARIAAVAGRPCSVAPCASREGAAVGAALAGGPCLDDAIVPPFALGPSHSEPEAKAVLENCRLDYLYEPRWPRLLERVSRMLERGKLIAWFQGAAEFGDPLWGSRSVLCDPSSRYARDNVNVFLRGMPPHTPIPLAVAHDGHAAVDGADLEPWRAVRTPVAAPFRDALRGATDTVGHAHAYVVPAVASAPLADLLALHWQRTRVPGLLNVPLAGLGEPTALTPRDGVRAAFASSVDALVMHRFLVVKDYWQMQVDERSGG